MKSFISLSTVFGFLLSATAMAAPTQYVALAFDGSLSLPFWNESREFAAEMNRQGKPLRFTYFISGVYFLHSGNKSFYNSPEGVGRSAIGWGKNPPDILQRIQQLNLANQEHHEIASHANGHFDGTRWNLRQWNTEFDEFNDLIFNAYENNGLRKPADLPTGFRFGIAEINGFRAPQLGRGPNMDMALQGHGFTYDTSRTSAPTYWPEKLGSETAGFWNFPLASLRIAGTGKRTLSMDYNFYVAQSGAQPDPSHGAIYEQQMYETYLQYFQNNYNGNRAPIHIGHHFSKWNGGAYWRAMKRFAQAVCGLRDVVCGTYTELNAYMEELKKGGALAQAEANTFDRSDMVAFETTYQYPETYDIAIRIVPSQAGEPLKYEVEGRDAALALQGDVVWNMAGNEVAMNTNNLPADQLVAALPPSERQVFETNQLLNQNTVGVHVVYQGREIISSTHALRQDLTVDPEALEERALTGDPVEAHGEE